MSEEGRALFSSLSSLAPSTSTAETTQTTSAEKKSTQSEEKASPAEPPKKQAKYSDSGSTKTIPSQQEGITSKSQAASSSATNQPSKNATTSTLKQPASTLNNTNQSSSAGVQSLLRAGYTEDEVKVSRERLNQILKEVDPNAELSPEVEEILLQLSLRFVQSTTEFASKLAIHRGSNKLNVADLRLYVEKVLGMKIPGFSSIKALEK